MKILKLLGVVVVFLVVACTPIKTDDCILQFEEIVKANDVKKSLGQQSPKEIAILNSLEKESLIAPKIGKLGNHDRNNVLCLALNIYNEARGSSIEDRIATSYVVFNRYDSKTYPLNHKSKKSLCDIVFDKYQFCWTNPDVIKLPREKQAWSDAQSLAYQLYYNQEHRKLAKDFALKHYVVSTMLDDEIKPKWIEERKLTVHIGKHAYMAIRENIDDNNANRTKINNVIKKGLSLIKLKG